VTCQATLINGENAQSFVRQGIKITTKLQQNNQPCDWSDNGKQWPNRDLRKKEAAAPWQLWGLKYYQL